ncbi:MAG: carboxypeptidase regulatory-like domain-containing protein [Methanomassiliicoccales archaeon]
MVKGKGASQSASATNATRISGMTRRFRQSWLGRNWHIVVILAAILFTAFFVRSYFGWSTAMDNGYLVSGGSDSYYHERVIDAVMGTGQHLVHDPMLDYPDGMRNVRPPLYDWSVAVTAQALSGLGMDGGDAMGFTLVLSTAFWGTLTVIPVYLMGRAAFGNKAGLLAAFLFALMPGHIQRSVLSNADHDAMVLFFVVWCFYFLLVALMGVKGERWVSSWWDRNSVMTGLRAYLRENQRSLLYAALSGISLAAVAMIWKGFTYVLVIVLAYLLVQILINRFRNVDSMGLTITVGTALGVGLLVAAPTYLSLGFWNNWFDIPVYLAITGLILGVIFTVTRDYPWTLVLPSFAILASVALLALSVVSPGLFDAIITGQGYFVQSKLYSTISEAQAPDFSNLVLSFGMVTFWLAFAGVVWAAYKVPRNISAWLVFVVVWSGVSMFMAVSAGRFMFNAAPAFAVTGGWITAVIIDRLDFKEITKSLGSFKGTPVVGLRKAIRIRHVLGAVFIVLMILVPNVWFAVDAGIPEHLKSEYSQEVYSVTPDFMKPADYDEENASSWYFGAFSHSLPQPNQYWPAAWDWFSQRDSDVHPEVDRPAFLSWWDYGFESIREGKHPTVADNFQNGYRFAGNFITTQSEAGAIGMLVARILEETGIEGNDRIVSILERYDVDVSKVNDIMQNPSKYVQVVLDNPDVYGPYASDLAPENAKWAAVRAELAETGQDDLSSLYHELRKETGYDIGYFAMDSRLFPFSATGQNIMHAPVKLAGHEVNQYNEPENFYRIKAVDQAGQSHYMENVTQDMEIVDYEIEYKDMFYDSMLYKNFMGYGPKDIDKEGQGIPGISGSLQDSPPMQGWNMSNFRMVYKTAYYNPYPEDMVSEHTEAWRAVSSEEALYLQEKIDEGEMDGVVDMSANSLKQGAVFLQYYDGAIIEGNATTETGEPYANASVTVLDEYGIPHQTVKTDSDGHYRVLAPFGDVEVVYSHGDLDPRRKVGTEIDRTSHNISYGQAMREKVDEDHDGQWDYLIDGDITLNGTSLNGQVYYDVDDDGEYDSDDEPIDDAQVVLESGDYRHNVSVDETGEYSFESVPPMDAEVYAEVEGRKLGESTEEIKPLEQQSYDIPVRPNYLNGTLVDESGEAASGVEVQLEDRISGETTTGTADSKGEFSFPMLLPGNYSLSATAEGVTLGEKVFSLENGTSVDREFTLKDARQVSGRVTLDGEAVKDARVRIMSEGMWTTTDSQGEFTATVPEGEHTLYSLVVRDGVRYVSLAHLGEGSEDVELSLVRGTEVKGKVTAGGSASPDTEVSLKATSGATMEVVTNSTGVFSTVLPSGMYTVYSSQGDHAIWEDVYLSGSLDIDLSPSITLNGTVWHDRDDDGTMDDEAQEGASVTVTDVQGRELTQTSGSDGQYSFDLPPGDYTLTASMEGYHNFTKEFESLSQDRVENVEMIPLNRTVAGTAELDSSPLGDITVEFLPDGPGTEGATTVTDSNGEFQVSLRPGSYKVRVDQNVTAHSNATRYQNTTQLDVGVGEDPEPLELDIVKRVKVAGTILPDRDLNSQVTIEGPEDRSLEAGEGFELYLEPGSYDVYTQQNRTGRYYSSLDRFTIDEDQREMLINTELSHRLSGSMMYENDRLREKVPVSITGPTGGTLNLTCDSLGQFRTYLPSGDYQIEADYHTRDQVDDDTRYVVYTGERETSLSGTTSLSVHLDRSLDNSTVTGALLGLDGDPVAGELSFTAVSETAMDAELTATSGGLTGDLAPGEYEVYARQSGASAVFLGRVEIVPHQENELNIQLEPGVRLTGVTAYGGSAGPAEVDITSEATLSLESGPDGSFQALLPRGEYMVNATTSLMERGMEVTYSASVEMNLTSSTTRVIQLDKEADPGVRLEWDSSQQATVAPGGSVAYTVRVVNTGNIEDTYSLSVGNTEWEVELSKQEVTLPFGTQNSQAVTVTIDVPEDAKVDHNPVFVEAASSVDPEIGNSVSLDADVLPVQDVELSLDRDYPTSGQNYSVKVRLGNNGNIEDTFSVKVVNQKQLASLGWDYEFAEGNKTFEATVEAGKPAYFDLHMLPNRDNPDPNAEVVLLATSSEGNATDQLVLDIDLPRVGLPTSGLSVTGEGVSNQPSQVPDFTLGLGGLTAVMLVVALLLGHQKGVFKRRKR